MGRGRRKEGRHKEQNVPTATHQDTGVRYESAAAKEALMPRGDYVRITEISGATGTFGYFSAI